MAVKPSKRWHERRRIGALICVILLVGASPVAAQDREDTAEPLPLPEVFAPDSIVEPEATVRRPFILPETSRAPTVLRGAVPDLRSSDRLPPDALESVARSDRLLRAGSFAILPRVRLSGAYDDNVNASDTDREDDISANLGGSLRAESLFERHSLGFGVDFTVNDLDESVDQDSVDWRVGADGRLDLTPRSALSGALTFTRGTQSPEATEAGAQEEPTVTEVGGTVAYVQRLRRLSWAIAGSMERFEAEGSDDAAEQDRSAYTISPGLSYEVSRRLSWFGDLEYELNDYDTAPEFGESRDSHRLEGTVGVDYGIGRTFSVSLGIGYLAVLFKDSERDNEHSPMFTAQLGGQISLDRVTLLNVGLDHSIEYSTAEEEGALVAETELVASIVRSLSPVSAVVAGVGLSRSDFIDAARTDHDIIVRLGYSRTLVRNLALDVGYRFSQRFSNEAEEEFYRNIVSIGLSAHF